MGYPYLTRNENFRFSFHIIDFKVAQNRGKSTRFVKNNAKNFTYPKKVLF